MKINKILVIIRAFNMDEIARVIQYSLQRDSAKRKFSPKPIPTPPLTPGILTDVQSIQSGIRAKFEHASAEVLCLTPDLIRISWEPGKRPLPYTLDKTEWEPQQIKVEAHENGCTASTEALSLAISNIGDICFRNKQDKILRWDNPPTLHGDTWTLTTRLKPEEHIYGLGERAGSLNLRPGNYTSWNSDPGGSYHPGADPLYLCTPIYLSLSSTGSYLIYFENSYKAHFRISDVFEAGFDGGMLRYYFITGELTTIFERLSTLIGAPYLPPRWALGYQQSRWGYRSEADIRKVVAGFSEHDMPLSVIHLDIDYMDGFRLFTFNPERFPDIKRLTQELDQKGVKVVATLNPAIKQDPKYKVYSDGLKKDLFCRLPDGRIFRGVSWPGWSVYPDFTNPQTREWWSGQYESLLNNGISGFWHDMNEPVSMTAWGDMSFPDSVCHDMDGNSGNHAEAHNLYGLLMNRAGFDGIRKFAPNKRPWILSRAGWAGLQKYAWNWTGDASSSWEALKQTIATILGSGLAGHAFSGVDIGGFSGDPEAELYLRWFQMGTFLPLFRTHSAITTKPREPWVFGEPTTSIVRKFLKLRYKLMPYLYTLVWEACQTGVPPIRPIFWEAPEDHSLWDVDDEFMCGEAILAAPVVSQGTKSRQVILPPGTWYSFWDDCQFIGPAQVKMETPPDIMPLFIKGGTILPMDEDNKLVLHVYPLENGSRTSHMYSDRGDGYEANRVDTYHAHFEQHSAHITWEKHGDYPFPYPGIKLVIHHKKLQEAIADERRLSIEGNTIASPIFNDLSLVFEA